MAERFVLLFNPSLSAVLFFRLSSLLKISSDSHSPAFRDALHRCSISGSAVALTGAGISVASGIPDFRSAGGLWTQFEPSEFATLDVFLANPAKAWEFFRALGRVLNKALPADAHRALAHLEVRGKLKGIVTQNIDGLHQSAGSKRVCEVHGTHKTLQCLNCSYVEDVVDCYPGLDELPICPNCGFVLKPNVVLFGEPIKCWDETDSLIGSCDLLLVIGTSASVFPIAELPDRVKAQGGSVIEFNLNETRISGRSDCVIRGETEITVPRFVEELLTVV
jgi:NAD-dependent deacetylase